LPQGYGPSFDPEIKFFRFFPLIEAFSVMTYEQASTSRQAFFRLAPSADARCPCGYTLFNFSGGSITPYFSTKPSGSQPGEFKLRPSPKVGLFSISIYAFTPP